ncbi:Agamous MADS-box protein [Balamuthia mandrillaris]
MVVVKVINGEDIRRLSINDSISFEELRDKIRGIYGGSEGEGLLGPSTPFLVKYTDDEGDLVSISSDGELADALALLPPKAILRLTIFPQPTPSPASSSSSAATPTTTASLPAASTASQTSPQPQPQPQPQSAWSVTQSATLPASSLAFPPLSSSSVGQPTPPATAPVPSLSSSYTKGLRPPASLTLQPSTGGNGLPRTSPLYAMLPCPYPSASTEQRRHNANAGLLRRHSGPVLSSRRERRRGGGAAAGSDSWRQPQPQQPSQQQQQNPASKTEAASGRSRASSESAAQQQEQNNNKSQQQGSPFQNLQSNLLHAKYMWNRFQQTAKERNKFNARFVCDVTVEGQSKFYPGQAFVKIWRVRNSGETAWPDATRLVPISGDQLGQTTEEGVILPGSGLLPGEEVDVAVDMVAPTAPGRYISNWRFATPSGVRFGQRLWADIIVALKPEDEEVEDEGFTVLGLTKGKLLEQLQQQKEKDEEREEEEEENEKKVVNDVWDEPSSEKDEEKEQTEQSALKKPATINEDPNRTDVQPQQQPGEEIKTEEQEKQNDDPENVYNGPYQEQLTKLASMGFNDQAKLLSLLNKHSGNLLLALQDLLSL